MLIKSFWLQPPSGPREGCAAFQEFDRRRRGDTDAVGMTEHRRALRAACPVLAGTVFARRECGTIRLRSRQHVMAVRRIAEAVVDLALFGQRRLLGDIVFAVQLGDILCDHDALGILPGPLADPVARIHRRLAVGSLGREIGAPGLAAGARRLRQCLAMIVGPGKTAEVAAIADADAGDEETGVGRLRPCRLSGNSGEQGCCETKTRARKNIGEIRHRHLRLFLMSRLVAPACSDVA